MDAWTRTKLNLFLITEKSELHLLDVNTIEYFLPKVEKIKKLISGISNQPTLQFTRDLKKTSPGEICCPDFDKVRMLIPSESWVLIKLLSTSKATHKNRQSSNRATSHSQDTQWQCLIFFVLLALSFFLQYACLRVDFSLSKHWYKSLKNGSLLSFSHYTRFSSAPELGSILSGGSEQTIESAIFSYGISGAICKLLDGKLRLIFLSCSSWRMGWLENFPCSILPFC